MVAPAHPLLTETTEMDQTRGAKDDRDAVRRDRSPKEDAQGAVEQAGARQRHKTQVLLGELVLQNLKERPDEKFSRRLEDFLRRILPRVLTRDVDKDLFADLLAGLRRGKSARSLLLDGLQEGRCGPPIPE